MAAPTSTAKTPAVFTVDYERWSRRKPWRCLNCGALVEDTRQHASWHANASGFARLLPRNPCRTERVPKRLTVHIDESGWPLR